MKISKNNVANLLYASPKSVKEIARGLGVMEICLLLT
jgi:hypothetical protein